MIITYLLRAHRRFSVRRALLAFLSVACFAADTWAQAQTAPDNSTASDARGPISLRNMRPYNLLFLQFLPESPDILSSARNRYDLQLDIANNLLIPASSHGIRVVEDNEYQRLSFAWRRGLGKQTEIGLFVPVLWRNGGFLDGILSGYHHLVGLPGNAEDDPLGRDHWPQYRSLLQFTDANGRLLVDQGNAFGLGEITLTAKRILLPATRRAALALRAGIKLPTGNPSLLLGSGSMDGGISLDGRYSAGRDILFYGNLGGVLMGKAIRVPNAQTTMLQTLVAIEYHPNHRDSFVLQVDGNSLAVRTGNGFADRAPVTATFGYKRVLDRHRILYVSFSENGDIHNYTLDGFSGIGPDVSYTAGIEWSP